ncbi:hypothetical protein CHOTACABRAS_70 [Bacillus phage Chotacabras]|nr:hypothetical protein CHOTACABRAS_70 [Bacillus phage Chotacabras]
MTQVKISELAKELEGMSEKEVVEKSMELAVEQDVTPVAEAKIPEKEEEAKEEEPKEEEKTEEAKEEEEEVVEKSADKKEDKEDKKDEKEKGKDKGKDKDKKEDKEEKEEVKKSEAPTAPAEASELISGAELLSAFEAVVKSYEGVKKELKDSEDAIVEKVTKSILPVIENIAKHFENLKKEEVKEVVAEEPKEEEVKEPEVKEEEAVEEEVVEKSMAPVEEEEELHGKAVEYIAKSADAPVTEEVEEEVVEEVFKAADYASTVVDIAIASGFDPGTNNRVFQAVNRVKEGRETAEDIDIFKKVLGK